MAILLKCGAVFLHVPKTGGKWVERVLYDQGLVRCEIGDRHLTADGCRAYPRLERGATARSLLRTGRETLKRVYLERVERRSLRRAFMFCFVRHPLAWYESFFKYSWRVAGEQPDGRWIDWGDFGPDDPRSFPHPWAMINGLQADRLSDFVRGVNRVRPGYVTEMYGWYTNWDHESRVEFVGKQERLADDLVKVLRRLNVPFDEQRLRDTEAANVSVRPKTGGLEWDPDVRAETERLEHAGLARYGYLDTASPTDTPPSPSGLRPGVLA